MRTSSKDPYALTTRILRKQLDALPLEVREAASNHYIATLETKLLVDQTYQCQMISKLEKMLRVDADSGTFVAVGGHESGVYESFFRVCPGRFMSRSQFIYALVKCLGSVSDTRNNASLVDSSVSKLYDTFDTYGQERMDWRLFLCLLVITVQPLASCMEHLKCSYSFYASYGDLDLECPTRLALGVIKDFMSFPISIPLRDKMKSRIHSAWEEVKRSKVLVNINALTESLKPNPDDALVSYQMFIRMLDSKIFQVYMKEFTPIGKRDPSPLLYRYEEELYCPSLVRALKTRRRDARNNIVANNFKRDIITRSKKIGMFLWKQFIIRRCSARVLFLWYGARRRFEVIGRCFDKWRRFAISDHFARELQRAVRGYLGRTRRDITKEIVRRSVVLQSVSRKVYQRRKYTHLRDRRHWAAVSIQRCFRGFQGRCRVRTMVLALYDMGRRALEREKESFLVTLRTNAVICIQRFTRWLLRRKNALKKMKFNEKLNAAREAMDATLAEAKRKKIAFQQMLAEWYRQRKVEHDRGRMHDAQTTEEKSKIAAYRRRVKEDTHDEGMRQRAIKAELDENARVEAWLARWDKETELRMQLRRAQCERALAEPTKLEEILLLKEIKTRVKKHIKVVLRKADTQKVPMELPEATIIATKEMVDEIVAEQIEIVKSEMRSAAEEIVKAQTAESDRLVALALVDKKRKRGWAQKKLVFAARSFLCRKILRHKAYERYKKYFDTTSIQYYYMDIATRETSWSKPKSLGAYDIDVDPGWVVMHDSEGDKYFYDPRSWVMSAQQPMGSAICDECSDQFAIARLLQNDTNYCEICFNVKVEALQMEGLSDSDIIFKPFQGNLDGAVSNHYFDYGEQSWRGYLEGQEVVYASKQEALFKEVDVKEEIYEEVVCHNCQKQYADRTCDQCGSSYCSPCFGLRHNKAPWSQHTFTVLRRLSMGCESTQEATTF